MNAHPTREEDFDLLALGALDADERQAIESHIASCEDCARKLAAAQGRVALLAFAAPEAAPSPRVKEGLLQKIRAFSQEPAIAQGRPATTRTLSGWWAAVLIPAVAIAAIAAIFLWVQNANLDRRLEASETTLQGQRKELDRARALVDLVQASDTMVVNLAQQSGAPTGSARVLYNQRQGMMLYLGNLAAAPEGKSYQLWLVPVAGKPMSAGVLSPNPGQSSMTAQLPPGTPAKAFAITLEPEGGRPQPTGPMVLVGPVS